MIGAQIKDQAQAFEFLFGGVAHTTLKSLRTGKQFTYRIVKNVPKPPLPPIHSVSVFVKPPHVKQYGPSWHALGFIRDGVLQPYNGFVLKPNHPSFRALEWAIKHLPLGTAHDMEIWHQGECGRCGRLLTHPVSIATGFGPECTKVIEVEKQ
jgi:hypothetical protein